MSNSLVLTLSTCGTRKDAEKLAEAVVGERLAACATFFPTSSVFFWKNKLSKEEEFLVLFKTCAEKARALEDRIRKLHPYEVPEIVSFETERVSKNYLDWVLENTRP